MLKLKRLVKQLGKIRGRHTELVTVYIPAGYSITDVATQLFQEKSTASNIKSKTTRKNVLTALEKIIQHLKLFKQTPPNGLVVFCGNVSEVEGREDIRMWSFEPPMKMNKKIYWCDQTFVLDPLKELMEEKEIYGLIVLDASEATIGLLKGKAIERLKRMDSNVPAKSIKGGMCLSPNTFVQLYNGRIAKINEITKNDNPIASVDFRNWKTIESVHNQTFTSTIDKKLKIKTVYPRLSIEASPNHRFFVPTDNGIETIYASSLKPGMHLLTVRRINLRAKMKPIKFEIPVSYQIIKKGWEFIKVKRKKLKITQEELAKKLNIHKKTYSKLEKGDHELQKVKIDTILKTLKIGQSQFYKKYTRRKVLINLPNFLDNPLCEFLGYTLGDGSVEYGRITLNDKDKNLLEHFMIFIKKLGLSYTLNKRKEKGYFELRIHNQLFINIINEYFPGILGVNKSIPKNIHSLSNPLLSSFIRGLFDAEGYVESRIGVGMTNENIIRILQFMLLRFGIVTSYSKEKNSNKHKLEILDLESIKNFSNFIGFNSKHKKFKLNKLLVAKKHSRKFIHAPITGRFILKLARESMIGIRDFTTIHNFFVNREQKTFSTFKKRIISEFYAKMKELKREKNDIKRLRKVVGMSVRKLAALANCMPYKIYLLEKNEIQDKRLRSRIVGILKLGRKGLIKKCEQNIKLLTNIYKGDIILTKVKKINIKPANEKFYDISIPGAENFIANCMIVHNSQRRYDGIREDAINEFLTKVGEIASELLLRQPGLKGLIVGGPGGLKEDFVKKDYLNYQLRNKILGTRDVGYTDEHGLEELVNRSEDLMKEATIVKEKEIMEKFFSELQKNGPVVYGYEDTMKALESGAVETLLLSEMFDIVHAKLRCECGNETEKDVTQKIVSSQVCRKCGKVMNVESTEELSDAIADKAKVFGTKVEYVSVDTREGAQFKELGGIGAFLRYKLS